MPLGVGRPGYWEHKARRFTRQCQVGRLKQLSAALGTSGSSDSDETGMMVRNIAKTLSDC